MSTDCDHKAQRTEHHNFETLLKFSELQYSAVFYSLQSYSVNEGSRGRLLNLDPFILQLTEDKVISLSINVSK